MNFCITRVYHEDQHTVLIDVTDDKGILHTLSFDVFSFYGLTADEMLTEIREGLKDKLASELQLQPLVGETFAIDNVYRKSFAADITTFDDTEKTFLSVDDEPELVTLDTWKIIKERIKGK